MAAGMVMVKGVKVEAGLPLWPDTVDGPGWRTSLADWAPPAALGFLLSTAAACPHQGPCAGGAVGLQVVNLQAHHGPAFPAS